MPSTLERTLRKGSVVEVVDFDQHREAADRLHLRRIRVKTVSRSGGYYTLTGTNLKGQYAKNYRLPIEPLTGIQTTGVYTGWIPSPKGGAED